MEVLEIAFPACNYYLGMINVNQEKFNNQNEINMGIKTPPHGGDGILRQKWIASPNTTSQSMMHFYFPVTWLILSVKAHTETHFMQN